MVLTVQKTSEIPQLQILEIPVVVQRQVPLVTVQKPVEFRQVQFLEGLFACPLSRLPWF